MHPPEPIPPPAAGSGGTASPAQAAAVLTRELARYGITGIYSTAAEKVAVISVAATVTVWTNGHLFWCTVDGQRRSWPVADAGTAAARLASLARPASASLLERRTGSSHGQSGVLGRGEQPLVVGHERGQVPLHRQRGGQVDGLRRGQVLRRQGDRVIEHVRG